MTAAGWYHATGDPIGTNRYWDGAMWLGDAVAAPSATVPETAGGYELIAPVEDFQRSFGAPEITVAAASAGQQHLNAAPAGAQVEFAAGLTVLAIGLAVLKAIPLAIFALLFRSVIDSGTELDRAIGVGDAQLLRDFGSTFYLILVGLALPLVIQLIAALAKRPTVLFCVATVLTLIDIAMVLSSATGSLIMLLLSIVVLFGQGMLAIWAFMIMKSKRELLRPLGT